MVCYPDIRSQSAAHGMKILFCLLFLIALGNLTGCASDKGIFRHTAIGPKFQLEKNENPQNVTIYIYRPWRFAAGFPAPIITINGEEILLLRNGGYTKINATIGKYILETHHSNNWVYGMEDHIVLNPQQNQTYFVRVMPFPGMGYANFDFSLFDEQDALKEISDTDYLNPKKELYQNQKDFTIVCKVGNTPTTCKEETKNLEERSTGSFVFELLLNLGLQGLSQYHH